MCHVSLPASIVRFPKHYMRAMLRLRGESLCNTHAGNEYLVKINFTVSTPLHPTTPHCNTLQHTATHCNTLHHTATHCNTLQHTGTHCNTLQHTALHSTVCCSEVRLKAKPREKKREGMPSCMCVAECCSVLQSVAVCCSVLQCVAVCCSVLHCATASRQSL